MKKLLHERLRECKRKTSYLDLSNGPGVLISKQTAKELADEIECYYVPREIVDQILNDMYMNAEMTDDEILRELADRFYKLI